MTQFETTKRYLFDLVNEVEEKMHSNGKRHLDIVIGTNSIMCHDGGEFQNYMSIIKWGNKNGDARFYIQANLNFNLPIGKNLDLADEEGMKKIIENKLSELYK